MSRADLEKYLGDKSRGWSNSQFLTKLENFCDDYKLSYDLFFLESSSDKNRKVIVKDKWKPLALALMRTYSDDPYIVHESERLDKVSLEMIMKYHLSIIDIVENEFPADLKYSIVNSSPYLSMLGEHVSMEAALKKLNEFIVALVDTTPQVRAHLWDGIHEALDCLIHQIFETSHRLDNERKQEAEELLSKYQLLIKSDIEKKGYKFETIGLASAEKIFNQSRHYHEYMTMKDARDKDNEYQEQCANISQFLAYKLHEELTAESASRDIQCRDGKLYHVIDGVTNNIKYMQAAMDALQKNYEPVEAILLKKAELQAEIDAHLQKIRTAPRSFVTIEEEYKNELKESMLDVENSGLTPGLIFRLDFCKYAKKIREQAEQRLSKKKPFENLLVAIMGNSTSPKNEEK